MGALNPVQVIGDLGLQRRVNWLAQVVAKQHIFGRMVESASSSNTQCPSGRRYSSNALVADAMLASREASFSIPVNLLTECIWLDIP